MDNVPKPKQVEVDSKDPYTLAEILAIESKMYDLAKNPLTVSCSRSSVCWV